MSMIEALAAGAPLVAARSPAAEDLVRDGENGVLCEPDADSLARGMARVLAGADRQALREGALRSARGFDVRERARQLLHIYETVYRGGPSRVPVFARRGVA